MDSNRPILATSTRETRRLATPEIQAAGRGRNSVRMEQGTTQTGNLSVAARQATELLRQLKLDRASRNTLSDHSSDKRDESNILISLRPAAPSPATGPPISPRSLLASISPVSNQDTPRVITQSTQQLNTQSEDRTTSPSRSGSHGGTVEREENIIGGKYSGISLATRDAALSNSGEDSLLSQISPIREESNISGTVSSGQHSHINQSVRTLTRRIDNQMGRPQSRSPIGRSHSIATKFWYAKHRWSMSASCRRTNCFERRSSSLSQLTPTCGLSQRN